MDNQNRLIQIEPPPPQVLEYLQKRPETDFKCLQNALPDDPSGERRSTYVNWINTNRDPDWTVDTSALDAWEYVWKMWKRKLEEIIVRNREETNRLRDQRDEHWNRYLMVGAR